MATPCLPEWNAADEANFALLNARRENAISTQRREVYSAAFETLERIVKEAKSFPPPPLPGALGPKPQEDRIGDALVDGLIANAGAIRDALAPYDSKEQSPSS